VACTREQLARRLQTGLQVCAPSPLVGSPRIDTPWDLKVVIIYVMISPAVQITSYMKLYPLREATLRGRIEKKEMLHPTVRGGLVAPPAKGKSSLSFKYLYAGAAPTFKYYAKRLVCWTVFGRWPLNVSSSRCRVQSHLVRRCGGRCRPPSHSRLDVHRKDRESASVPRDRRCRQALTARPPPAGRCLSAGDDVEHRRALGDAQPAVPAQDGADARLRARPRDRPPNTSTNSPTASPTVASPLSFARPFR